MFLTVCNVLDYIYNEVCSRVLQSVKLVKFVANQYLILYGRAENGRVRGGSFDIRFRW